VNSFDRNRAFFRDKASLRWCFITVATRWGAHQRYLFQPATKRLSSKDLETAHKPSSVYRFKCIPMRVAIVLTLRATLDTQAETSDNTMAWNGSQYYLPLWRTSGSSGQ
jgi:hypothetical protein